MTNFLTELLGKQKSKQFFKAAWPGQPMVCHGRIDRLRFARMPELQHPRALAKQWQGRIMAWAKPDSGLPGIDATPDQVQPLYDVGYTLFFSHVQRQVPAIRALADEFADATGVSKDRVSCEVFFSRKGSGAPPHFDGYSGFNIQLTGEKRWQLRRNEHVQYPMTGGAMGKAADPIHYGCARLPFPEVMPDDAEQVLTKPGSVVFVPAGYWHATQALDGDSTAIVFSMNRDSWSEKLTKEIERRLNRTFAISRSSPLLGTRELYDRHRDELEATLDALKRIVSDLEAETLMRTWLARDRPRFAIASGVVIDFVDRESAQWSLEIRQRDKTFTTKMRRASAELLYALSRSKHTLGLEELCAKVPHRAPTDVSRFADELVDIGLLRRVGPEWLDE